MPVIVFFGGGGGGGEKVSWFVQRFERIRVSASGVEDWGV